MADDEPDKSEKTEDPSQKKLDDAHEKGDVVKSQEVTTWFMMLGSALLFALMAPATSVQLAASMKDILANADQFELANGGFGTFFGGIANSIFLVALVPLAVLALAAIAANLIQHRPVWSFEPIKPKWSKVSPIAGAKRLFSTEALVNFAKGLLKLTVVGLIMFAVLWPERDRLETMMTSDVSMILFEFQELGLKIFGAVLAVVTIIALADFMYQRYKWWEKQKMTMKEVRDEYKQMEGDPQIKSRIRQLRQERAQKRMMSAVPDATVVVTNPTHFAVALRYDDTTAAPICVAKGADAVALRIRGVAEENDVPVVENPPLARALFASVDIDEAIPNEHFKAVAQVIGYVMRLKNRSAWRA